MNRMNRPAPTLAWKPTRRQVLLLGAGTFLVAVLPFARRGRRQLYRRQLPVMGTFADLAVVADDPARAHAALDAAAARLEATDRLMSRFDRRSDVGRFNAAPRGAPVAVSRGTAQVLERALDWARATGGRFDPCLLGVTALWDVNRRTAPPAAAAVARFAGRGLFARLGIDASGAAPRVVSDEDDVGIDLGGIAKGWGVDQAVAALRDHGVRQGLVNVGGDLYALGRSEDGDPWRVGVRSPARRDRLLRTLAVEDAAVATSGDTEQGFDHGGRRYHHLMDPATGEPIRCAEHALTVQAPACIDADAAATAWFGLLSGAAAGPAPPGLDARAIC